MRAAPCADRRGLVAPLLATVAVRILLTVEFPLLAQEAYHWAYSVHPDLSYFDHPPLVAWAIRAGTTLFGLGTLGLRAMGLVFALGTTLVGLAWLRDLGARPTTLRLWVVAMLAVPILGLGIGLAMTESPLAFGWVLCLWALWRARAGALGWWLLAGLGAGIALLSKYSAAFLLPGGLVVLALDREMRRQLLRPGPWLALVVATLCFTPVLLWNQRHDWVSFRYQLGIDAHPELKLPHGIAQLVGGQLLVVTPVLAAAVVAAFRHFWRAQAQDPRALWFMAFGLPCAAVMALTCPWQAVKLNWLLPTWLVWVPAALLWIDEHGALGRHPRLARAGAGIAGAVLLLTLASPLIDLVPWQWGNRWSGWDKIAATVREVEREVTGGSDGPGAYFIASEGVNETASLSYWLERIHRQEPDRPPTVPVLAENTFGGPALAYDFWTRPAELAGRTAIVVLRQNRDGPSMWIQLTMNRCFSSVSRVREVEVEEGGIVVQRASIWVGRGYTPVR
ncbi:MAG: glycosyltransferase family 39 protein [Planctomycetota bacterium]